MDRQRAAIGEINMNTDGTIMAAKYELLEVLPKLNKAAYITSGLKHNYAFNTILEAYDILQKVVVYLDNY